MAAPTPRWSDRAPPPEVQLGDDLGIDGAVQQVSLPLVVGILADRVGHTDGLPPLRERPSVPVDRDSFADAMAGLRPRLRLAVPDRRSADGALLQAELSTPRLDDLHPVEIVRQVPPLRPLREARGELVDLPGAPGRFRALIFLQPHVQIGELPAPLQIVADLPPPARGGGRGEG